MYKRGVEAVTQALGYMLQARIAIKNLFGSVW
jgi:hypothetical protein